MTVCASVHRKTADLVRDAAEDGLRGRWPSVRSVDRAELWSFDVDGDDDEAMTTVREILDDTTLVVNPNVHRYVLRPAGEVTSSSGPDGAVRVTLLVHDLIDARGAAVLRTLRVRRGQRQVTGVRRAIQWTIDVAAQVDEAEAIARAMTGGDGRGGGLLANRHSQDVRIHVEGE